MARWFALLACLMGNMDRTAANLCGFTCRAGEESLTSVCGTDGTLYANGCVLAEASCKNNSLQMTSVGCTSGCKRTCSTQKSNYICGSDGLTYTNLCTFHNGVCDKPTLTAASAGVCPMVECMDAQE